MMIETHIGLKSDKSFSSDEAIEKVKNKLSSPCCKSYKLIIMDYYMPPGMSGEDGAKKIQILLNSQSQKSYIICLTAQREGDFELSKGMSVFDEFYEKPLKLDTVRNILTKINT